MINFGMVLLGYAEHVRVAKPHVLQLASMVNGFFAEV